MKLDLCVLFGQKSFVFLQFPHRVPYCYILNTELNPSRLMNDKQKIDWTRTVLFRPLKSQSFRCQ